MPLWMKEGRERMKKLNQNIVQNAVNQIFRELENRYGEHAEVVSFLSEVKQNVIENAVKYEDCSWDIDKLVDIYQKLKDCDVK